MGAIERVVEQGFYGGRVTNKFKKTHFPPLLFTFHRSGSGDSGGIGSGDGGGGGGGGGVISDDYENRTTLYTLKSKDEGEKNHWPKAEGLIPR